MKNNCNFFALLTVLFITISTGCSSVKPVNDFAAASLKGLSNFESLNYSFSRQCNEDCAFELERKSEIQRNPQCNCAQYEKADSVTLLIYFALKGYFDGLTHLSANDLARYNLDAIEATLTTGSVGTIQINPSQAAAFTTLTKELLNATTAGYRKRKIKKFVSEANAPLQVLLDKFQFILSKNLNDEISFRKEKLYDFYRELFMETNLSVFDKTTAATAYYSQWQAMNQQQQQINALAAGLKNIALGHQFLFENIQKVSGKKINDSLIKYESHISNNVAFFNKIKN